MMAPITGLYAALLGILIVVLGYLVTRQRQREKVALGDGGREPLMRAIAVHRNAIEYVPIALLLFLVAEVDGAPSWSLHVFGLALVIGRLLHAWGLSHHGGTSFGRFFGTLLTWLVIIGLAAVNLWLLSRPLSLG